MFRFLGAIERQDRDGVDLGGADLRVVPLGLELAVPKFSLGLNVGTLLQGSGPFAEFPPNHDLMPFGLGLVAAVRNLIGENLFYLV